VLVAAAMARFGNPVTLSEKAYRSFVSSGAGTVVAQQDLNRRFSSLSGNGRVYLWHAAWHDYEAHPWLGSGAGSYESYWLQHRHTAMKVRDAHSLYLEVLAELGPIGLALLIAALAIPLTAAIIARRNSLVPTAAGAYSAYLLHAGADWDWEMVGVTLPTLFCAAAILMSARPYQREIRFVGRRRVAILLAVLMAMAFAVVGEIGNSALAASEHAAARSDWHGEQVQAQKAARWAPWSAEPLRRIAEAEYSIGRPGQARDELHQALKKDPHNWELWFDFAVSSAGADRRHALQRALELNPFSPEITESLPLLGFPHLKIRSPR
jgi:O-Antigen ligase